MESIEVQLPCGARQKITGSVVFGRGNPPSVLDPQLSRQQVQLRPVEGLGAAVLNLQNVGQNPIIVESRQPADQLQAAAAGPAAASEHACWQFSDLLEQGESTCVGPDSRFYLASRRDTTLFTLLGSSSGSGGGGSSGGGSGRQQQPQHQHALAAAEAQVAADAALAAALAAADDEDDEDGSEGLEEDEEAAAEDQGAAAGRRRRTQLDADAALAAALAAEDDDDEEGDEDAADAEEEQTPPRQQQQQQQQEAAQAARRRSQMEADAALAAALAAQEEAPPQQPSAGQNDAIAATKDAGRSGADAAADGDAADRPAKRLRLDEASAAAAAAAAAGGGTSRCSDSGTTGGGPPAAADTPCCLLAVTGLQPRWNTGCLGASLSRLVAGPLAFALVSNYMIDLPWLLAACPDLRTADKLLVVHGWRDEPSAAALRQQAAQEGLVESAPAPAASAAAAGGGGVSGSGRRFGLFTPPLPLPFGTHHSKAFVLGFRGGGLRVIIHTANLIHGDCNNKTQGIWWQDFPPHQPPAAAAPPPSPAAAAAASSSSGGGGACGSSSSGSSNDFGPALADYVAALKLPGSWREEVQQLLAGHDMSSARVALVPSVPGSHSGPLKLHAYGHMRLRALLSATQLPGSFRAAATVVQASSLGALDESWLTSEFLGSLTAGRYIDSDVTPGNGPAKGGKAAAAASPSPQKRQRQSLLPGASPAAEAAVRRAAAVTPGVTRGVTLHFVWPTAEEVQHSREGWTAGGSLPARLKNVDKIFLHQRYRRFGGTPVGRQSAMPHIKSYCRFLTQQPLPQQQQQAAAASPAAAAAGASSGSGSPAAAAGVELPWWLVTSHNLSKAAWGALQKGGGQLMVRSYELGVLATPALEAAYQAHPHRHYCCTPASSTAAAAAAAAAAPAAVSPPQQPVRFFAWNNDASWPGSNSSSSSQRDGAGSAAGNSQADPSTAAAGPAGQAAVPVFIPVPYRLPPEPYRPSDRPWCVDVTFPGQDCFGRKLDGQHKQKTLTAAAE